MFLENDSEKYPNAIFQPRGASRVRSFLRNVSLSILAASKNRKPDSFFVRSLNIHYVLDNQKEEFERLIDDLQHYGDFITTDELLTIIKGERELDGKYFHLSFDDGLECIARNAVPVLEKKGVPAIVFVNSGVVSGADNDNLNLWRERTNYRQKLRLMDWGTLLSSGLEVGGHTRTHPNLSAISSDRDLLEKEILGCKEEIETNLRCDCNYFAWPFGGRNHIDHRSLEMIRAAGYKAAFGAFRAPIRPGETDFYQIPRHHLEPQWPLSHSRFFALGGLE